MSTKVFIEDAAKFREELKAEIRQEVRKEISQLIRRRIVHAASDLGASSATRKDRAEAKKLIEILTVLDDTFGGFNVFSREIFTD